MQRARRDLRAALNRGAAISTLICVTLGVVNLFLLWDDFPAGPIAVLLGGFLGLSGWALRRSISHADDMRPVRALAGLSLVMFVCYPFLGPIRSTILYSPLTHLMVIGAVSCSIAFGAGVGVAASVLAGYSTFLIRAEQTSVYQGACEGALFVVTGVAGAAAIVLIRRANDKVAVATSDLWELQALAAQGRHRDFERGRFDAIVHDAVLGSLLVAGRGQSSDEARRLAAEAVRSYDATEPDPGTPGRRWADRITETADHLGLDLRLRISGSPGDTWLTEALFTATAEALSNVARHSGQRQASVTAVFTPRLLRVLIQDSGCGFDPDASSTRRAGVATSIRARMRAVGGTADVESEPGKGTLVTLTGRPPTTAASVPPARWSREEFLPMVLLAIVAIGVHSAIGLTFIDGMVRVPAIDYAAPGVLVATLAWTWWASYQPRRWVISTVCSIAIAAVLSANVVNPEAGDWRLWYVGALDGVVAVIAFRYTGRGAVLTALAIPTVIALVFLVETGELIAAPITTSSAQLLVCALLGTLLRRGMAHAATSLNRVAAMTHRLRIDEVARVARAEEVRFRVGELSEASLPMLRRIAAGEQLAPEERERCLLLEAAIRDQLVARPVLSPALRLALDEARARAVRVELAVDSAAPSTGTTALRELLLVVLPRVPARATVRATWQVSRRGVTRQRPAIASVVVTGREGDIARLQEIASSLIPRSDLVVDLDEDVLIVDLVGDLGAEPPNPLSDRTSEPVRRLDDGPAWTRVVGPEACPSF